MLGRLVLLFLSAVLGGCETPPHTVLYPSATPTINYIDEVVFEWESFLDETEVGVFCGQGNTFAILASGTASGDGQTGSSSLPSVGYLFSSEGWATSFPATCSVSMWSIGDTSDQATSGGDFIITSQDAQQQRFFAASTTQTLTSSGSTSTDSSIPEISSTAIISTESSSMSTASSSTSGTSVTPGVTNSATSAMASTTQSTPTPTTELSHGLSTGDKAGIAVGSIIGVLLIVGALVWFFIMRRRLLVQKKQLNALNNIDNIGKPELSGESGASVGDQAVVHGDGRGWQELDGNSRQEMYVPIQNVELAGSPYGKDPGPYELPVMGRGQGNMQPNRDC